MSDRSSGASSRFDMRRDFKELLDEFRKELLEFLSQWTPVTDPRTRGKTVEYPLTDLMENDEQYIIESELPGVEKKQIIVEVAADLVRIKGSINLNRDKRDDYDYLIMERQDQDFNKEIMLPEVVNPSEADAVLDRGVLRIILPKKTPDSLRWIRIVIEDHGD